MIRFELLAALFFALSLSAWLGRAELRTDDTGILIALIGLGGFVVAMIEPQHPWIWGIIVPAGIIVVNVRKLDHTRILGVLGIAAVTVTVGCLGAYMGAFVRRRISNPV